MFTKTVKTELRRIISLIVVGAFLITQASPVWALAPSTGFEDDIDTQSAAKLEEFKIETATITEVLKTFPDLPAEIKGQVMDAISKGKSIADIQERLSAIEGLQPEIKDRIVAILDEKVLEAKQADEAAEGAMREEVGQASFDILVRKLEGEIELRQQYEQAESIAAIKSLAESHARIIEQLAELDDNRVIPYLEELLQKLPKEPYYGRGDAAVEKEIVAWGVVNITIQMQLLDNLSYSSEINPAYKAAKVALAKLQNKPEGAMREAAVPAEEAEEGVKLAKKLQMPLNAQGDAARAARFLEGGYNQRGLGVAENAAVDGSRAIGNEGDQGYYVGRTADGRSGREVFLSTVSSMSDFFKRRAQILGKTIKYVIKPGIGGQHTPFQGIADVFQVIDPTTGVIVGEYELGKDYEAALSSVLAKLGADWDQVAVIPSSKSGSTDETMMIFVDVLNILLKHIAEMEVKGINGEQFAKVVLDTMHQVNFPDGKEKPGKDLFKGFSISLVGDNARAQGLDITNDQIKAVFGKVLGNMFFETTDRPQASRLSAFIRNSGLDTELGDNVPGFGAMFDNVGGRWTGDLHMMAFLAFHNLDAAAYWDARYSGIQAIREGTHVGNRLGNTILDKEITDIALVVPDELFWFGKSIEQNFNESIWQQGFANLVAVKQSQWEAQKNNYVNQANRLVVNLSGLPIQEAAGSFKVFKLDTVDVGPLNKQDAAIEFAKLFNAFYGATQTAGDRLIARALHAAGYTVDDVDMSDLDNPATQIVQQNLYLRQPYVELGKGLLEARLKALQQRETEQPGAIALELDKIKQAARDGQVETNIADLKLPEKVAGIGDLVEVIRQASAFAESQNRKLVPFIYLEGDKFYQLREQLIAAGLEWVMQGTGDQHISYQQVLAQPQKYLPLIVSVVPEQTLHGQPAIGFAKGYLNNVSPNMVRDFFAEASYRALTDLRKDQGGVGVFLRMADSAENISNLAKATEEATAPIRLAKAQTARRGETDLTATAQKDTIAGVAQPEGEPEGAMREEVGTREETDQRLENASLEIEDIAKLSQTASTKGEWQSIIERLTRLGADFNVIPDTTEGGITPQQKARFDDIIVKKSMLCRDVAGRLVEFGDQSLLDGLVKIADKEMDDFLKNQVKLSKTTEDDAKGSLTGARKYLKEWLNPNSKIPKYMLQGIYRAMLEGRNEDILYSFGPGWKEFGTAGIRNQAVQSSYVDTIQRLELREFATNQFASVLPGPNLINVVTLLQQEASIVRIMRDLQAKIAAGDPAVAKMDPEFVENLRRNRVTIAYDSRINGEYFAKILAAAFLRDGVDVDLFDNASGVPHLAWAAKREGSAFGFLISASHSEANYNGFKAFLGHQMSQVDKDSKNMIVKARSSVGYNVMNLDLAMPDADLDDIIRSTGNVRWIGGDEQRAGKDYLDRGLVSFYPWYYEEVRKRSPLALLDEDTQRAVRAHQTENPVRAVYSAFFGVGATPAADFRDFLKRQGYEAVDIVKAQTEVMDGMFPGHKMPDPGIVQGWISNLIDYFVQYGGDDLSDLDKAVEAFNNKDVGIATDPDIDRAGIMINLPAGVRGNIKERLIAAIAGYIDRADAIPQDKKEAVKAAIVKKLKAGLQDKMLLTANDAWTFMMYWKLKMMEENGQLEKDRVYIIEKSHVTTSALERVAALYRDKGYKVYVVDTYVGFTEIGKKGRDLFKIARLSAEVSNITRPETLTNEQKGQLEDLLNELRKADVELRKNVPQQTAGVSIIDDAIKSLAAVVEGSADHRQVQGYFYALSRMHILAGVEESNGYGELGRWNPELGKFELNHISDKDGSLAAFEFMELIAYGSYKGQSAYDMYKDLMSDIGYVCTVNSALYHPGLTGVADKVYEIQALEKIAAYELQKRLDRGEQVYLFNGRYRVKRVEVFRDAKNDKNYLGFAEEGIRLYVETLSGGEGIVTFRPSGTGDSNRVYSWLLGKKPEAGADLEGYRKGIDDEMDMMVRDFYGEETRETGYASASTEEFTGLIKALKESGLKGQFETLGKLVSEGPLAFTPAEQRLYEADVGYARAAKQGYDDEALLLERRKASRQAWAEYLESPEAKASQVNIPFSVNGEVVAEIPRAAAMAWQTSLVDYLIGLAMDAGADKESIESADKEMLALAKARFDSYGLEGAMREEGAADWADLDWNKKNIDSMLQPTKDAIRLSEAVQQETKQIVVFKSLLPKAQTRKPEFEASHAMWKYDMGRALDQRELADGTQRYKLIFVDSPEDLEKKIANGDVDVNNAIAIAPKEEADALPGDMKVLAVDRDNDPEGKQFVNLPALVGFAVPLVNLDREQIEKDPTVVDPIAVLYEAITGNKPENMKGLLLSTIYSRQEGVPKRFDIKLPPAQKFDFNQIDELQKRALEVLTSA